MKPSAKILRIFRIPERGGPVLVVRIISGDMRIGSKLILAGSPGPVVEVIGIDPPSSRLQAGGRIGLVITPDPGESMQVGSILDII
jgi:hypothetical protein